MLQYNVFIDLFVFIVNIWGLKNTKRVSEQLLPREIAPWLGLGFGQGLALELGLGAKFPWEKANCPRMYKNVDLSTKRHVWGDTVLKSGCVQFLNLLTLTEMGSVSDRKWFLLTHLLSLRIFECWKIRKCCFSSKIMHLSRHIFEKWAWYILKLALLNRDA